MGNLGLMIKDLVMKRFCLILAVCLIVCGCATYYRVTDLATSTDYYTESVNQKSSGAVMFKDSRSGSMVTLQTSSITEVTKEEFTHAERPD